jgi:ATP-binding cassette subfamily B protein RaxB
VLLLDEATSDLDVTNEKLVNAAIRATRVTRVIVAHRPETIRSADRVINLDEIGGHGVAHLSVLPGAGRVAVQIGAT